MGLPIGRLVVATNQNDILHRAISFGRLCQAGEVAALDQPVDGHSRSVRILSGRFLIAYGRDGGAVAQLMAGAEGRGRVSYLPRRGCRRWPRPIRFGPGLRGAETSEPRSAWTLSVQRASSCARTAAVGVKVAQKNSLGQNARWSRWRRPIRRNFPAAVEEAIGRAIPPFPRAWRIYMTVRNG